MESRQPSSVYNGLSTGRSCYERTELWSLDMWKSEVRYCVCRDWWNRVNDLLKAHPTYHCKDTLLNAAEAPLSGTLRKEPVLLAFRTLLERCTNNSHERNVVMHVARTVVHFGRLEQLQELLTTDIPAVRRDLWDDANNLRTLRGLLVHNVCIKRPDALSLGTRTPQFQVDHPACLTPSCQMGVFVASLDAHNLPTLRGLLVPNVCIKRPDALSLGTRTPQFQVDHSACLTLACQMGVFAASLEAAESDSSNFGRLGSPLYKAVYYNQPHLVRILHEIGAVSHREMLQLISLAEENTIKGNTMTRIQQVEALANDLALSVQNSYFTSDFDLVSTAWDFHDHLKTIHHQSLTENQGFTILRSLCDMANQYRMPGTDEYRAAAREIADFLKSHASQPRSLQNQCLLALSREAGVGRDRLTKINKLGLPGPFQRVLNFEDPGLKAQKGQ